MSHIGNQDKLDDNFDLDAFCNFSDSSSSSESDSESEFELGEDSDYSEQELADDPDEEDEEHVYSSSDESCASEDFAVEDIMAVDMVEQTFMCRGLQIAKPPEVLECSIPILKEPGVPLVNPHKGFRLCGDNLDKNIRRRHMRSDRRTESLHYFLIYAVQNRVDFSALSDVRIDNSSVTDICSVAESLLPTPLDDQYLKANISTLIARILYSRLNFFGMSFDGLIDWHIKHRYYQEMSSKSVVVSIIKLATLNVIDVHSLSKM